MSAIQAFKTNPSTKWVVKSAPGCITIRHKMGCSICLRCLNKKDISSAVADAQPELARYQDNYYHLLEDQDALKETLKLAEKKAEEFTIKNLEVQDHSLEQQLQEQNHTVEDNSANEGLILKISTSKRSFTIMLGEHDTLSTGRTRTGQSAMDIESVISPCQMEKTNNQEMDNLPIEPEETPQDVPIHSPQKPVCPTGLKNKNNSKVIPEAGIPAIGGLSLILLPP
ncbi:hypothetical protein M422DRAFT_262778 [Sphaerobolus stellatus SS14]|uniref:Uncharacterized protein n=1 Tax=Sphaerobolus stellatus (strain SS14) TaxID=990650 RepID=A0A0C9VCI0_SPHS4|nr:hypothetical protein M422DRAFT_262778 [Sphaerobolus stellatus SS14]